MNMSIPLLIVILCLALSVISALWPVGPGPVVWALWAIAAILLCGVHL